VTAVGSPDDEYGIRPSDSLKAGYFLLCPTELGNFEIDITIYVIIDMGKM
jgi:hypothetical protein